jgi:hypothetical protein
LDYVQCRDQGEGKLLENYPEAECTEGFQKLTVLMFKLNSFGQFQSKTLNIRQPPPPTHFHGVTDLSFSVKNEPKLPASPIACWCNGGWKNEKRVYKRKYENKFFGFFALIFLSFLEVLLYSVGNGTCFNIVVTSGFWPRVRARALRAPVIFRSLPHQTGRCAPPPRPLQLRCLLFDPQK